MKCEMIEKHKQVVTKWSWGWRAQHREHSHDIVRSMHGARWALETSGGPVCKAHDCLTTMLYT